MRMVSSSQRRIDPVHIFARHILVPCSRIRIGSRRFLRHTRRLSPETPTPDTCTSVYTEVQICHVHIRYHTVSPSIRCIYTLRSHYHNPDYSNIDIFDHIRLHDIRLDIRVHKGIRDSQICTGISHWCCHTWHRSYMCIRICNRHRIFPPRTYSNKTLRPIHPYTHISPLDHIFHHFDTDTI